MEFTLELLSVSITLVLLFIVFRLILKGRLRAEYSIIWILCSAVLMIFSLWREGLDIIAGFLGIYYPPALLFLGAILATVVFLLHLSVVSSKFQNQIKDLTQEMGILKKKLEELGKGENEK
ncbi:MAG TPA: DUF2304 domain-containing protein [Saprospiraceae bacterium]|nr:DUF2304 domain-containing protein [Saprospiraceae bacterium]HPN70066.1 DUF2304 domain-containing protein [Saprospiraceae bacterium]